MIKNNLIPYTDEGTQLEGFSAYSSEKKQPLVILCHAWRGRDDFICEKAMHLASLGFASFALDMYGKGILGESKEENAALKRPFMEDRSLSRRRLLKGFEAACDLSYTDASRVAVIGFGFGGLCALDLARSGADIKGVVSIYGHFDPPLNCPAHPIKAKVLILHGYKDPVSPLSELLIFQQELEKTQVDWQTHLFGNTAHAFATPGANDPVSGILYHPASAKRAWNEAEKFLKEVLY